MVRKILSTGFVLASIGLYAQAVITGEVHDTSGNAIPNVKVSFEGSTTETITDDKGKFIINIPSSKGTLTFSAENFHPFSRSVGANTPVVYVVMKEGSKEIPEVVISTQKKLEVNKLNIKNLDAPMTVNVLNRAVLQKWNINNIEEASKMVAGVNPVKQYAGFQFFNIRGFDNFVVLYDGIRDERHTITQSAPVASFANVERVEFLKGPSGDMFGHSALGGIINIIRKKPTYTTQGEAKFTIGSYNTYNVEMGVGGPISNKLRYRVDAGLMNTDGFKGIKEKNFNSSIMLQYTPDHQNTLEFFAQYNNDHYGADAGVPATNDGKPYDWINPMINLSDKRDYLKNEKKEFYLKYKHRFDFGGALDYKLSYFDDSLDYLMDEVLFTDKTTKTLSRKNGPYHFKHVTRPLMNQLDFSFGFKTWDFKHKMIVGNTFSYLDRKTWKGTVTEGTSGQNIPIVDPVLGMGERRVDIDRVVSMKEVVTGFYLQDWIEFADRFRVLLGGRYDYFDGMYDGERLITAQPNPSNGSHHNFTYRAALSFQPIKNFMTIYGSSSSFFKPTRSHDHRTGKLFKPEEGIQMEAGIKLEKRNKLNVTISGFYIEKKNLIVGHNVRTQVGKAYSRGFEVDADAEIFKGLYAKVGYAFTDAFFGMQTPEPGQADISHNKTPWTPKHSFNAWANYEPRTFMKGFGIGLGVFYTDKTYRTEKNDQILPAYTLLNGAIYYQAKNNIRIGLNVENILNKTYYNNDLSSYELYSNDPADEPYQATFQINPGRNRNYKLTISYSF